MNKTLLMSLAVSLILLSGCGKDKCGELKSTPENQLSMDDKMYFMEHCLEAELDKLLED